MRKLTPAVLGLSMVLAATLACAAPFAYFVTPGGNLLVVDTATNTLAATVAIGANPFAAAVNPAGTRVYATNFVGSSVSVIDTSSNMVIATIPVAAGPQGVALDPAGSHVYVASFNGGVVSVIDPGSNSVGTTIPLASPVDVVVNPAGTRLYAVVDKGVTVIDTSTNLPLVTIPTGNTSRVIGAAVSPDGTTLYVGDILNMLVLVIDTASNTLTTSIPVTTPFTTNGLAFNPAGTQLYVSNGSTVSIIDPATNTVSGTVPLGTVAGDPNGVAVTPDGSRVYAATASGVETFDTATDTVASVLSSSVRALGHFIGPAAVANGTSFTGPTATGTGNATATFACAGANCVYVKAAWIAKPGKPGSPPPLPGITFPQGLFDFAVAGDSAGFTAAFTLTFPQALPPGTIYYKYGPTAANTTPHWYALPAVINGNTITFSITDGGLGDDDLTANGAITDPGGPGVPVQGSSPVPTLRPSGLLALIGLLASIAAFVWPRKRKA
jgi:YVTN family beta-propeller protein